MARCEVWLSSRCQLPSASAPAEGRDKALAEAEENSGDSDTPEHHALRRGASKIVGDRTWETSNHLSSPQS